jgi:PPM family protein phosphatase
MLELRSCGATDVGLRRSNNEDAYLVRPDIGLLALSDGMGGAAAGEVASGIYVRTAAEVFGKNASAAAGDPAFWVQEVFRLANERMIEDAVRNPQHQGMGCTAELLAVSADQYLVGHVGDSRTYLFRGGELRQITKDHSLVQQQVDLGLISVAESKKHAMKNILLRALGIDPVLRLDISRGRISPGDIFLLCSDGLTDMLDDAWISGILAKHQPLQEKVKMLIDGAKSAGGRDNVTVVLCQAVL